MKVASLFCMADPEVPMGERDKRIHANDESPRNTGEGKAPQGPDPDTLEGPGGRGESKGEEDARNKATRRGER